MMARIHYDILQIQPDASTDEIQHAYRKLALRYHPDQNSSPDAALRMAAINEAFEILREPSAPSRPAKPAKAELTSSILDAARAVILRCGWSLSHEDNRGAVFAIGKPPLRIILTERLTSESLAGIARRDRDIAVVLAVHADLIVVPGVRIAVIDLMRAECHGEMVADGPCKSLLSRFL